MFSGATHPVISTTKWHVLPAYGASSTLLVVLNQLYAVPFIPGRACNLDQMAVNVSVLGLGTMRAGLYKGDPSTGLPTTLLGDFGTQPTTGTGIKAWTGLNTALPLALYYFVVVQQGAIATFSCLTGENPIVADGSASFTADRQAYVQTPVSGVLPGAFGTPSGTAAAPQISLRLI